MGVSGKGLPVRGKETPGEVLLGLPVMLGIRVHINNENGRAEKEKIPYSLRYFFSFFFF